MRKQLLTICLLPISIVAFSQTTVSIPDDAFEAYMETTYAANIVPDGSTTDGSITFSDINLIEDIDLSAVGTVADLTGVSSFVRLKNLYCQDNVITGTVDLTGLDRLTNFYCYNNPGLTGVDVTGCVKLYHVKAYDCAITSIDFSVATLNAGADPTRLRYVYVNNNALTSINVSGNTGIWRLDVYNNNLTSIDITGFTTLTHLRFQNNDISGDIDVSANPGLGILGTYNNDNLASIDLGGIPYTNFTYFKTSSSDNLNCIISDNPTDFEPGGALETAIGTNYSVDAFTNFVPDMATCNTLSVSESQALQFQLYPNPSSNLVTVHVSNNSIYEFVNVKDQVLLKGTLSSGSNSIDVSSLSSGMYFMNVQTNSGYSAVEKFIKN